MTETKNGLWIIYSLEERPFNVFVIQERYESIIICFVIPSISDDFNNNKKIRLPIKNLGRVWKLRGFYVKVCIWQISGSLNIIYNMQVFYLVYKKKM